MPNGDQTLEDLLQGNTFSGSPDLTALLSSFGPEAGSLLATLFGSLGATGTEAPEFLGIPNEFLDPETSVGGRGFIPAPADENATGVVKADPSKPWGPDNIVGQRELRFTEENVADPMAMSPGQIRELKDSLIEAGLLTTKAQGYTDSDIYDPATQDAYRSLLGLSNVSGRDPEDLLVSLSGLKNETKKKLRDDAVRAATVQFTRTDPAAIRNWVRDSVSERLRRDVTDTELAGLSRMFREFESAELAQTQERAGVLADIETGALPSDATVLEGTDVDPKARVDEFLAQQYAGTIRQNKRVDEMQIGQHNLLGAVDALSRRIGGS